MRIMLLETFESRIPVTDTPKQLRRVVSWTHSSYVDEEITQALIYRIWDLLKSKGVSFGNDVAENKVFACI